MRQAGRWHLRTPGPRPQPRGLGRRWLPALSTFPRRSHRGQPSELLATMREALPEAKGTLRRTSGNADAGDTTIFHYLLVVWPVRTLAATRGLEPCPVSSGTELP